MYVRDVALSLTLNPSARQGLFEFELHINNWLFFGVFKMDDCDIPIMRWWCDELVVWVL